MGFWRGYIFLMLLFSLGIYGRLAVHYWFGDIGLIIFTLIYVAALMSPYLVRPKQRRN